MSEEDDAAARVTVVAEEEKIKGLKLRAVEAELSRRKGDWERKEEFLFEEVKDLNNVGFRDWREAAIVEFASCSLLREEENETEQQYIGGKMNM